ncbi:MAG: hypothetical protein WC719_03490 [Patescibacteria group bacterium]|jgi:hypothetical protein
MKKTIYSLIIASFVFGLIATAVKAEDTIAEETATTTEATITTETAATVTATAATTAAITTAAADAEDLSGLEKIISPDQIKNFRVMKKIGTALYGIRKGSTTPAVSSKKPEQAGNSSKLEKIAGPALINLYEKIQRIGTALWGVRKQATSTPLVIDTAIAPCVVAAIEAKDKALMARVTAAAVELNAALSVRSSCQQAAVMASTTPREALNGCVKSFGETQKTVRETSKNIQKETWGVYQESLKACRANTASTAPVPMIEDGGNLFD